MNNAPRIAFLGLSDRVSKARNVDPRLSLWNILGLRTEIVSFLYPLQLHQFTLVVAGFDIVSLEKFSIKMIQNGKEFYRFDVDFRDKDNIVPPIDPQHIMQLRVSVDKSWTTFVCKFPDDALIFEPGIYDLIFQQNEDTVEIGSIDFYYAPAPPLTQDRIEAIRSNPKAIKYIRFILSCKLCPSSLMIYTGLERSEDLEKEGNVWYKDISDEYTCECNASKIPLKYIRESFHSMLDTNVERLGDVLTFSKLYENSTLKAILERFERLLQSSLSESDMQLFFEENPILWHRFTPIRIIKKAPILTKYETDFAILSRNGELFLIEIEEPNKPMLRKNGDRTADFNHAFDQIINWLHVISEHRIACLEMMGLKSDEVSGIRGVVIYGRNVEVDQEKLRKLKSSNFGNNILFYTYDDIADGLSILIRDIRDI